MSNKTITKLKRVNSGKKRGETPDGSVQMTPTASTESMSQERLGSLDAVLDNEEVAALTINPEDLIKLHPPRPPSSDLKPRQQPMKVLVKEAVASAEAQERKSKKVGVLHPLPPGTVVPISKQLALTPPGPRFDEEGTFMNHTILGKAVDFASELERKKIIKSTSDFIRPPPIIEPKVTKPTNPVEIMADKETTPPKEKHALEQWNKSMAARRTQQQDLAVKMLCYPENLAMSKGDECRQFQEQRTLIDRAIPPLDAGKGYRVGSEFWKLPERIGDEETGIQYTLTKTEKGEPPEIEYIGIPSVVCKEKGLNMESNRNASVSYTKRQDPKQDTYFQTRQKELKETLAEVEHFRPDFSQLQVIGHTPGSEVSPSSEAHSVSKFRFRADSLDSLGEEGEKEESNNSLDEGSIIGPALKVGNTLLQWTGPPVAPAPLYHLSPPPLLLGSRETRSETVLAGSKKTRFLSGNLTGNQSFNSVRDYQLLKEEQKADLQPIQCRVLLECSAGEIATSYLHMGNCGNTTVYYSWEPIAKPNPLGTSQAGDKQRFYFDTRGGVLLPGEELDFPFYFKSRNPGIFSEVWSLTTSPVLNKGRPLLVTLKGVACQEDLYRDRRNEIERVMVHREAVAAAERIVDRIVDSVRTPPRSPPPREIVLMEEDIFRQQNPESYYYYNLVQQLKHLHDMTLCPELFQPESASLTPTSFPAKGEKSGGKKGEEKSGGTSKRGGGTGPGDRATPKEKKAAKAALAAPAKDEIEIITEPALPEDIPKWDLSIESLLKIIMNVEDEGLREDKLKQLNQLVGDLSFPPLPPIKKNMYHFCYLSLCEAIDDMVETSARLCQVMGLPARDWEESGAKRGTDDHNILNIPASPVHARAKDKRAGGSKEKKDKRSSIRNEREKTPTLKSRKHPRGSSPKAIDTGNEAASSVEIDPILDQKYKINFHACVHRILECAVDKMVMLIETEKATV